MSTVRLQHPDLPGQIITVPAQAAAHHRAAGWVPAEDPEPRTRAAFAEAKAAAKTDTAPEPVPDTAPRRRATKEAEQQ